LETLENSERLQSDLKDLNVNSDLILPKYFEERFEKEFHLRTSIIKELKTINNADNLRKSYFRSQNESNKHLFIVRKFHNSNVLIALDLTSVLQYFLLLL